MKLSLTATLLGLTPFQKRAFRQFLIDMNPSAVIHGGAIGGDWDMDGIASELHIPRYVFQSNHPTKSVSREKYVEHNGSDVVFVGDPQPPLKRNPLIVKAGDALAACPKEHTEVLRSGTWTTVRLARRLGRSVKLLYPD